MAALNTLEEWCVNGVLKVSKVYEWLWPRVGLAHAFELYGIRCVPPGTRLLCGSRHLKDCRLKTVWVFLIWSSLVSSVGTEMRVITTCSFNVGCGA